jgi:NAD-dependent protein deacetylase/lipoamidase
MWAQYDPMEYATIEAFENDPEKVWSFYSLRYRALTDAEPNDAHRALAELERRGFVSTVITQNIDLLHERAGSREVIEVHGSIRTSTCPACGAVHALGDVVELLGATGAPECTECGAVLKPDVVFFGEQLRAAAIDRAYALARDATLLLVVGSTLEVWPVAELPLVTLDAGGSVAIVNRGPTAMDAKADLKIEGSAGETLEIVAAALA